MARTALPVSSSHRESHVVKRIGWLRASVLGANDGLISTSSLIVGVSAAHIAEAAVFTAALPAWSAARCRWRPANTFGFLAGRQ